MAASRKSRAPRAHTAQVASPAPTVAPAAGEQTGDAGLSPVAQGESISAELVQLGGAIGEGEQLGESGLPPVAQSESLAVTHVQVRALRDGFRRAGRAWSTALVLVPIDEFSDEQIEQLATEPMLYVTFVVADSLAGAV